MICIHCRRHKGLPVPLPLVGRVVSLCNRCRSAAFIAHMRGLIAHG